MSQNSHQGDGGDWDQRMATAYRHAVLGRAPMPAPVTSWLKEQFAACMEAYRAVHEEDPEGIARVEAQLGEAEFVCRWMIARRYDLPDLPEIPT